MSLSFDELRKHSGDTDVSDVPCPLCIGGCSTNQGRQRKCLRIWDSGEDFISYTCARCNASGFAKPDGKTLTSAPKVSKQPAQKEDKTGACQFMWDNSLPAVGSIVQTYLKTRQCCPQPMPPTIRFLPRRDRHPPAMISRFGFEGDALKGVHLTKLLADGSGKHEDGDMPSKLTIGDTVGLPIVISASDPGTLIIAEGIEDAATLALVTGWSGWAAGTAGRIPAVVATAKERRYKKIYVAQDADNMPIKTRQATASARAIEQALSIHPIIPLPLGGLVKDLSEHLDANKMLIKYGHEYVKTAIDLCELQHRLIYLNKNNPEFMAIGFFHQFDWKCGPIRKKLEKIERSRR